MECWKGLKQSESDLQPLLLLRFLVTAWSTPHRIVWPKDDWQHLDVDSAEGPQAQRRAILLDEPQLLEGNHERCGVLPDAGGLVSGEAGGLHSERVCVCESMSVCEGAISNLPPPPLSLPLLELVAIEP